MVLLTTVASVAARPLMNAAYAMAPNMVVHVSIGSGDYEVDITSAAALFLSPERAIPEIIHGLQEAMAAKPDQATEPGFTHEVEPGDSVHITHSIENQAVTVSISITVDVGEPATVTHETQPHPPEHEQPSSADIQLPIYISTA